MSDVRTVELWKFVEGRERIGLERIAEHVAGIVSDIGPSCALDPVDGYPSVLQILHACEVARNCTDAEREFLDLFGAEKAGAAVIAYNRMKERAEIAEGAMSALVDTPGSSSAKLDEIIRVLNSIRDKLGGRRV